MDFSAIFNRVPSNRPPGQNHREFLEPTLWNVVGDWAFARNHQELFESIRYDIITGTFAMLLGQLLGIALVHWMKPLPEIFTKETAYLGFLSGIIIFDFLHILKRYQQLKESLEQLFPGRNQPPRRVPQ